MKKYIIIIIVIVAMIIGGYVGWKYLKKDENNENKGIESNYQAERSSTTSNTNTEQTKNEEENNIKSENTSQINADNKETSNQNQKTNTETELASFSTKIHNKDSERQNNITITCKRLSGKEIKQGETFSFCNTVGKATSAKGYQEADIYVDGKKDKGLGGGNCQVSTTLYNAVLKVSKLAVVERHQHSNKVPYIQDGKDAAVAYGSYDFKFKNNTKNTIKIVMQNSSTNITAKIYKIE